MAEHKVAVVLTEKDIQAVEAAVVDRDAGMALGLLKEVIKPQIDAALTKGHCKPAFEWQAGAEPAALRPPIVPGEPRQ